MNSNYEIFKQRSDGSFVRIETVKNIEQATSGFEEISFDRTGRLSPLGFLQPQVH